jgi:hypothetical protein
MTSEQEIQQNEEQFLNAKRTLDLDALDGIFADDVVVTGVVWSVMTSLDYCEPLPDEARVPGGVR